MKLYAKKVVNAYYSCMVVSTITALSTFIFLSIVLDDKTAAYMILILIISIVVLLICYIPYFFVHIRLNKLYNGYIREMNIQELNSEMSYFIKKGYRQKAIRYDYVNCLLYLYILKDEKDNFYELLVSKVQNPENHQFTENKLLRLDRLVTNYCISIHGSIVFNDLIETKRLISVLYYLLKHSKNKRKSGRLIEHVNTSIIGDLSQFFDNKITKRDLLHKEYKTKYGMYLQKKLKIYLNGNAHSINEFV